MRSFLKSTIVLALLNAVVLYSQNHVSFKSPPDWSYNKTIYEVNIRQFTGDGTFKTIEKHLPRLKEMGVGILWLIPIHPIGEKKRKGTLGIYYTVKNYKPVNFESREFKVFVM